MKKQEELYELLINYKVDAALVDINSLKEAAGDLQRNYKIKVTGILPKETFYGLVLSRRTESLAKCFRRYIEINELAIFRKMSQFSGKQKVAI